MNLSIADIERDILMNALKTANLSFQKTYPGDKPDRQPVHTVYGGANLFKSDTCIKLGEIALKNLLTFAPDFVTLAKVLELEGNTYLSGDKKKIKKLTKSLDKLSE
ncbi:MAG: phosphoenolpyruvate kinase, partial [Chitinophagaceae bacterium]|nr:phosphoenolpyruvate kinase [Chitinophagaceae bacterium]